MEEKKLLVLASSLLTHSKPNQAALRSPYVEFLFRRHTLHLKLLLGANPKNTVPVLVPVLIPRLIPVKGHHLNRALYSHTSRAHMDSTQKQRHSLYRLNLKISQMVRDCDSRVQKNVVFPSDQPHCQGGCGDCIEPSTDSKSVQVSAPLHTRRPPIPLSLVSCQSINDRAKIFSQWASFISLLRPSRCSMYPGVAFDYVANLITARTSHSSA